MKLKSIVWGLIGIPVALTTAAVVSCDESSKRENGRLTFSEKIFDGRQKMTGALANNVSTANGWKSVFALDGPGHTVTDKSFNEYSYAGMRASVATTQVTPRASDKQKPAGKNEQDFVNMYSAVANNSLIIAPGFLHVNPLESSEGKQAIANKAVILIDGDVKAKNIASVKYKSHQSGFLAGYMAGVYLNLNYETFKKDGLKVATFGGIHIEGVTPFMMGFQNGVKFFNENKDAKYKHKITFIDNGRQSDYFSGGFDEGQGTQIAENLLSKGADLIFPVAGPQTKDVVEKIKTIKGSTAKVIGVDVAQEKDSELESHVVFSALKELETSVKKMIEVVSGSKTSNDLGYNGFVGFGGLTIGDLDNGLVGVSPGKTDDTAAQEAHREANKQKVKEAAKNPKTNPLSFDF